MAALGNNNVHILNTKQKEESLTLEILQAVDEQSDVTQRHLASRLGVALGLANSYLKRCVRKGLIKVHQAPANRYLYYLTPRGFSEKSRLTARYLSDSFQFYRKAGESCARAFAASKRKGCTKVLLCGASELAEIASLRALDHEIEIVGVLEPGFADSRFLNHGVFRELEACPAFDVCLFTGLNNGTKLLEELHKYLPSGRIIIPDILGIKGKR